MVHGTAARARRPGLVVGLLASTLGVMGGAMIAPIVEVLRGALQVSTTAVGVLLTAHSLMIAVVSPVVGTLVGRVGPRAPLAGGLVLYALGGGAGLVLETFPWLLVSRLVLGVGTAAVFTCSTVVLLERAGDQRAAVIGWRTTAMTVGGFAYPLAAGALGNVSWHAPFALYLVAIPLGLATLVALPRTEAAESAGAAPNAPSTAALRLALGSRRVLALCGVWVVTTSLMMFLALGVPRRLGEWGITDTLAVALFGTVLSGAASTVVGLAYGRLAARLGDVHLLRTAALSWTAAMIMFALAPSPALLAAVPILVGTGSGLAMSSLTLLVDDAVASEQRASATSLQATALFGGQFVAPLIVGPIIDTTTLTITAGIAATAGTLLALALLGLSRNASRVPNPSSDPAVD